MAKWKSFFTRGPVIAVTAAALALVGIGAGMAEGASTATDTVALNGGDTAAVTCSNQFLTISPVSANSVNLTCVGAPTDTTTTEPPTTTTVAPTTTTVAPTTTTTIAPTTTTAAPPISQTTPPTGQTCVTGDQAILPTNNGYLDPADINNSNGYNTYLMSNVWGDLDINNNIKLCGSSPSNWNVTVNAADAGDNNGNVQAYPDVQQLYTDWGPSATSTPITALTGLTSTFSTVNPSNSIGQWESAYDLWFDGYSSDIMIWEDTSTRAWPTTGRR